MLQKGSKYEDLSELLKYFKESDPSNDDFRALSAVMTDDGLKYLTSSALTKDVNVTPDHGFTVRVRKGFRHTTVDTTHGCRRTATLSK